MKISENPMPERLLWRRADVMEYLGISRNVFFSVQRTYQFKKIFLNCEVCTKKGSCKGKKRKTCRHKGNAYYRRSDIVRFIKEVIDG